jgi:hypothetical protein
MKSARQQVMDCKEAINDLQRLLTAKAWSPKDLVEARQQVFLSLKEIVSADKLIEFERAFDL